MVDKIDCLIDLLNHELQNDEEPMTNSHQRDWSKGWKLYYWQFGGGRGQYVRLMFEFCGVEWEEALGNHEPDSWKGQMESINKVRGFGLNRTAFAVPIVTHNGDFTLSQTGAIVLFLADLFPKMKPKNILHLARARQMLFQVIDVLEEAHTASHPVHGHESYTKQKEAADKALKEFIKKDGRLSRHLEPITAELYRNNKGMGWFYGDTITFIDLYVATFMRAFHQSVTTLNLADVYEKDDTYKLLREHRGRVEATQTYQNFAKSDRMPRLDTTPSFQA
eukprot:507334_1